MTLTDRIRALAGGFPRPFAFLVAGMFVNRTGTFVVPFLAIWLTQARHVPLAVAGAVASLWGVGGMVASPLGGFLADHIGRRRTMLAALTLGGTGMIALGFMRTLGTIAPMVFAVSMLGECYRPAMQAAVADLVPPEHRVRAYGLVYWAINLGVSFGLVIGGALAMRSFTLLFLGDGLTTLAFAAIVARNVPETRPAPVALAATGERAHGAVGGLLAPYRDMPFLAFILVSVLSMLVFMQHSTAMPLDMTAHGVPRATLGLVMALNGILVVFAQPLLSPALARRNRSRVLAAGCALFGAGFGSFAFAHAAPAFALGIVVWSLGEIGVLPIANTLVADVARPGLRGRYQGAYGLVFGVAAFAAPLLGTGVLQHFGARALWLGCAAAAGAAAAGHMLLAPALTRLRARRLAAVNG